MKTYTAQEKYRYKLKSDLLDHYGHSCKMCGMEDRRYLTIDHINGLEENEPKKLRAGYGFYLRLRREGYPDGYQTLCFHCNIRKQ